MVSSSSRQDLGQRWRAVSTFDEEAADSENDLAGRDGKRVKVKVEVEEENEKDQEQKKDNEFGQTRGVSRCCPTCS